MTGDEECQTCRHWTRRKRKLAEGWCAMLWRRMAAIERCELWTEIYDCDEKSPRDVNHGG